MPATDIHWPADIVPAEAAVFGHNEYLMRASPSAVWAWLIRAGAWERWYSNCKRLRFRDGARGPDLSLGVRFTWITFGVPVDCTVTEFEPEYCLAWRGGGAGASGYHGWVIDPTPEGCRVVTEEAQTGLVPRLGAPLLRRLLVRAHQNWLECLADKASAGPP